MKPILSGIAFCLLAGIDPDKTPMIPLLIAMSTALGVFWWGTRGEI